MITITPKVISFFYTPQVLDSLNSKLKIFKMVGMITTDEQKWKCNTCKKEIFNTVDTLPLIHCRCEYEDWTFDNQSLYIQKICKHTCFSSTHFLRVPVFQPSAGTLPASGCSGIHEAARCYIPSASAR